MMLFSESAIAVIAGYYVEYHQLFREGIEVIDRYKINNELSMKYLES